MVRKTITPRVSIFCVVMTYFTHRVTTLCVRVSPLSLVPPVPSLRRLKPDPSLFYILFFQKGFLDYELDTGLLTSHLVNPIRLSFPLLRGLSFTRTLTDYINPGRE